MPIERRLADFIGNWQITRTIRHAQQPAARYSGSAVWAQDGDDVLYRENGILSVEGHPDMHTEKRNIWRAPLDVFFADGRFFHTVPAAGGEAVHHCAPDQYHVTYSFTDWPKFDVIWRVQGPKKDYLMVSQFQRLTAPLP